MTIFELEFGESGGSAEGGGRVRFKLPAKDDARRLIQMVKDSGEVGRLFSETGGQLSMLDLVWAVHAWLHSEGKNRDKVVRDYLEQQLIGAYDRLLMEIQDVVDPVSETD